MEIKIQAIHFDATEQLHAFIEKKVSKLEKTYEQVQPATAMNKQASITVSFPGNTAFAEKTCDTFEESIDQCVDSLKVQLTKIKEKQRER